MTPKLQSPFHLSLTPSSQVATLTNTISPSPRFFRSCLFRKGHLFNNIRMCSPNNHLDRHNSEEAERGLYYPFVDYAWSKLSSSGLLVQGEEGSIPNHLRRNTSPARGGDLVEGSIVSAQMKMLFGDGGVGENNGISALRNGRYVLLETLSPSVEVGSGIQCAPDAIHVLNLVLFPTIINANNPLSALPILGIDLVTLPGKKHLIVIDFQPILPLLSSEKEDCKQQEEQRRLFPEGTMYSKYEERIKELHRVHVTNQPDILPWGGDVPPNAQRFFSPYVVWTRLQGSKGLNIIKKEIYAAFCDYFDLYLELMTEVQRDLDDGQDWGCFEKEDLTNHQKSSEDCGVVLQGHRDYLNYRQANDPARPMLTRLFGKEWTEQAISEFLFEMI